MRTRALLPILAALLEPAARKHREAAGLEPVTQAK